MRKTIEVTRTYLGGYLEIEYSSHGLIHREDGPAVIHCSKDEKKIYTEYWFTSGKLHREDGPAMIDYTYHLGDQCHTWSLHGHRYNTFNEWVKEVDIPEEKLVELKLKFHDDDVVQ